MFFIPDASFRGTITLCASILSWLLNVDLKGQSIYEIVA